MLPHESYERPSPGDLDAPMVSPASGTRGWRTAGLALALLLAACGPTQELPPHGASHTEWLAAALAAGRWAEPRFSGDLTYHPCASSSCRERLLCEPECSTRDTAAARHLFSGAVSFSSGDEEDPVEERRAAALWALVARPGEDAADEAIEMLQALVEEHPNDAALLTDLAAAHILRAQRADEPAGLTAALVAAQRAVEQDPGLPEALFNRALASDLLALAPDARAAWESYLDTEEEESPWAREGLRRLREIAAVPDPAADWERAQDGIAAAAERGDGARVRALVDPFRAAARLWVEEEVLPNWARALERGHEEEADRDLELARRVAAELAALQGDRLLLDAVEALDRAAADRRTDRLERLAEGHRTYGEAVRALREFDVESGRTAHRRARELLRLGGSPFSAWAEVGLAFSLYQKHRLPEAVALLTRLRDEAEASGYLNLQGRVLWILGLCQFFSNLPVDSRNSYLAALERYRETGERENQANLYVRAAEVQFLVGEEGKGWRLRHQALRRLPSVVGRRSRYYILAETTIALMDLPLPTAARELQVEAVGIARRAGDQALLSIALRQYAEAFLEDPVAAQTVLEEAFRLSAEVDEPVRSAIRARIRAAEGLLLAQAGSPRPAIDALAAALELLPRDEYLGYRARLLVERAAAYRAAAEDEGGSAELERRAVEDVAAGLAAIDEEWERVLDRRQRGKDEDVWSSYFEQPRKTFELMIRLLSDEGRHSEAFDYSERARARDLLDLVTDAAALRHSLEKPLRPLAAPEVERRLPLGTVLIAHELLEDRLLLWVFRRGRSTPVTVETTREAVDDWTGRIERAGREGALDLDREALAALAPVLLPPELMALVRPGEELVFVPDGSLHAVPYAALRNPATGRFLVEDHPIAVAPSATLYLYALERDHVLPRTDDPAALCVGDPAFERGRFLGLDRLPHALEEARQCGRRYPSATVLVEDQATREAFLRLAGENDVVHLAGHAVLNSRSPFKAMLVLAASEGEPGLGALYADELLANELPRTRLVVLSACSTAGGLQTEPLGVAPLVRPFLGAGVPAVVGTLWDVDDPAARRLLAEFHNAFREGASAAEALQRASLALLRDHRIAFSSPRSWAAFQVIGTASLSQPDLP